MTGWFGLAGSIRVTHVLNQADQDLGKYVVYRIHGVLDGEIGQKSGKDVSHVHHQYEGKNIIRK